MCPRIALTDDERHTLRALEVNGLAGATAGLLGISVAELGVELTAIRARLGVASTAAALAHLQD